MQRAKSLRVFTGNLKQQVQDKTNLTISHAGIGDQVKYELIAPRSGDLFLFSFVVCGSVVGVLLAISVIYVVRRHQLSKEKLHNLNGEDDPLAKFDYQVSWLSVFGSRFGKEDFLPSGNPRAEIKKCCVRRSATTTQI